ncbi:chemotaxis protein CheC [Faecalicatena sp. AGMB00832]|uniref:Chemotaxis protein CheC n=1 Tax=Faecalicatena faecalis TaxID=2726362 RepID=A0ABS6CY78_9FIRM|nr:chemotaxis protein CheC [Faecalicatena faecalis]MBU3874258.1 chemotaxis protein CheC [Faecalicatena faecalis]
MENYAELDNVAKDILKELGNIGTGNAVASLAVMMEHPFEVGIPMVRFVKYQDVFSELDIQEDVQAGILIRVFGELKGMFLFLMDEAFTRAVLDGMLEKKERNLTSLDEMERSVLSELGNIMCGSYIRALSQVTGMETDVSVPDMCVDMGGAILGVPLARHIKVSDDVLLIENVFRMGEASFVGRILFWPERESMSAMLNKLRE